MTSNLYYIENNFQNPMGKRQKEREKEAETEIKWRGREDMKEREEREKPTSSIWIKVHL